MDIYAATETAYKNGYDAGVLITVTKIFEELDILVDDWKHSRIQGIQFIDEITKLKKKFEIT